MGPIFFRKDAWAQMRSMLLPFGLKFMFRDHGKNCTPQPCYHRLDVTSNVITMEHNNSKTYHHDVPLEKYQGKLGI